MSVKQLAEADLAGFTGSEHFYRHWMNKGVFTDGIKFVAETAGAFWLIDVVFSHQCGKKVRNEEFQIWELNVNDDHTAVVTMKGDSNRKPVVTQEIPYTDFPMKYIKMYFENSCLCLPSER